MWLCTIFIGFGAGICSGLFGIGGAVVIVPMLMSFYGYTQQLAQGTTLLMFMIAPSLWAGLQYYKSGNTNVKTALFLWVGVFFGSALGAWCVNTLFKDSQLFMQILKKSFAGILAFFALKIWIS